jgi:hypothetical protein
MSASLGVTDDDELSDGVFPFVDGAKLEAREMATVFLSARDIVSC